MRVRLLPDDPRLGWAPYAYLVYLSYFVATPLLLPRLLTPFWWAAHGVALAAFLALYFTGYWVRGARLAGVALGIAALAVALTPVNPGAGTFFIYAGAFLGELAPRRQAIWSVAGLTAFVAVFAWAADLGPWAWGPALVFTPFVGALNIQDAEIRRKNARLRVAQDEVARLAQVAERERIARDLHDLLGHTLSVIVLKSELASRLASRDVDRAIREIREVERISREALAEVRGAVQGYRASGVRDEIARARETLDSAGVRLDAEVAAGELPPVEDRALALLVREAVTNIVRHAHATRAGIRLMRAGDALLLEVEDDGVGAAAGAHEGSGIAGMRARVEELGGTFTQRTGPGTALRIALPGARAAVPVRPA